MDSNSSDTNPNEILRCLLKIAEEIPSGVRVHDYETCFSLNSGEELFMNTNDIIVDSVKNKLQFWWEENNISEKLKSLKDLEEKSDKTKKWRPVTGDVNMKPIIVQNLLDKRKKLTEELEKAKEKSNQLRISLKERHEKLENQIEEMNKVINED